LWGRRSLSIYEKWYCAEVTKPPFFYPLHCRITGHY
jgi:hypothetical protein